MKKYIIMHLIELKQNPVFVAECSKNKLPDHVLQNPVNFIYDIRHADDDTCYPVTIEHRVRVNNWGCVISGVPLLKNDEDYISLSEEESSIILNAYDINDFTAFI